mgnify:CR=1 FL=1
MTEDVKRQMTAQEAIQDFARKHFPESHQITIGFYDQADAAIMDFSADYTTYVRYSAYKDRVIITGATRGCIARPVKPYGEHVNLFYAPLDEQQQEEISDLLDDFVIAYENGFADQEDLCDDFESLYDFIKDWEDRALAKMPETNE